MGNCLAAGLVLDDSIGECKPKSAFAEMHTAVLAGDKSLLLKALAAGADADPDRRFRTLTPLMWAAIRGHTSCLRVLLEYGASFDASTESGLTPTMLATIAGNADCLRLLIERGANINVVTRQGKTALDHAIERARVQCAAILITEARNTVRSHPLTAAQSKEGSISGGMQHVGSLQHHCLEGTRIAQLESLPIMEKLTALLVELAEPVLLGGEGAQDVFKDDRKCGGIHTSTSETSIQRWLVPQVELQMGKLIGSGAASRVYAGSWQGTEVAIKTFMLPQKNSHPRVLDSDSLRHRISNIQAEAELLASIRHPNILNFLALCSEPPCLITEKCEPGSLLDILHRAKDEPSVGSLLTWDKRLGIAGDAAAGMAYLHQRSTPCMHRNLKSSNILIMSSWDAKISGFGRSKTVHEATAKSAGVAAASLDSTLGDMNPRFLVPEVLKKGEWTLASDVYSFGIILWELMTWQMPWSHFSDDSMIKAAIQRGGQLPIPEFGVLPGPGANSTKTLPHFVRLIRRCMARKPEDRPSFTEVAQELHKIAINEPNVNNAGNETSLCVICMERPSTVALVHAHDKEIHRCCCEGCVGALERANQGCPVCRRSFEAMRIF